MLEGDSFLWLKLSFAEYFMCFAERVLHKMIRMYEYIERVQVARINNCGCFPFRRVSLYLAIISNGLQVLRMLQVRNDFIRRDNTDHCLSFRRVVIWQ